MQQYSMCSSELDCQVREEAAWTEAYKGAPLTSCVAEAAAHLETTITPLLQSPLQCEQQHWQTQLSACLSCGLHGSG